jgi:heme/copper-type cytochrome/quinol oxidase subunit 4
MLNLLRFSNILQLDAGLKSPFILAVISAAIIYLYLYLDNKKREKKENNYFNIKLPIIIALLVFGATHFVKNSLNMIGGDFDNAQDMDIFLTQPDF